MTRQKHLQAEILRLLADRGAGKTICPSEAARAGGEHAGDGLTHVLEISDIVDRLHAADALKAGTLSISVVPRHSVPESAGLSIGRISLYRQSG